MRGEKSFPPPYLNSGARALFLLVEADPLAFKGKAPPSKEDKANSAGESRVPDRGRRGAASQAISPNATLRRRRNSPADPQSFPKNLSDSRLAVPRLPSSIPPSIPSEVKRTFHSDETLFPSWGLRGEKDWLGRRRRSPLPNCRLVNRELGRRPSKESPLPKSDATEVDRVHVAPRDGGGQRERGGCSGHLVPAGWGGIRHPLLDPLALPAHHGHGFAGQLHVAEDLRLPERLPERAQHLHLQPGCRRPAAAAYLRPCRRLPLLPRGMALRRGGLQAAAGHSAYLRGCFRLHPHRPQRRQVSPGGT